MIVPRRAQPEKPAHDGQSGSSAVCAPRMEETTDPRSREFLFAESLLNDERWRAGNVGLEVARPPPRTGFYWTPGFSAGGSEVRTHLNNTASQLTAKSGFTFV